jgi:uncharacterized protein YqjF (DUF2071 family)
MAMKWHDLLFAHWSVPPEALRGLIPKGLELDTFEGKAWLGVVPFHMSGVRLRFLPPLPGTGAFPEINVRTYVRAGDRAGVWFFSLDAESWLAVRAARAWFRLPYFDARFERKTQPSGKVSYRSHRTHRGAAPAVFEAEYEPAGDPFLAREGTIEHWLTERYALFTERADGSIGIGHIDHEPWPLQSARAQIRVNNMTGWLGISLPGQPAYLHFARELSVVGWAVKPV